MRIDLNATNTEGTDPAQLAKTAAEVAPKGSSAGVGQTDTATLSADQARVRELVSQVNRLPEIRQDKVAGLQRAIAEGSYQVTSGQAAEALISAMHSAA